LLNIVETGNETETKINHDTIMLINFLPQSGIGGVCSVTLMRTNINTRLGTFGEVAYALAPKAVDQLMFAAYKVFPDSAASKGENDPGEKASTEQIAIAHLMRGVHW
jgi:hypothetical protein